MVDTRVLTVNMTLNHLKSQYRTSTVIIYYNILYRLYPDMIPYPYVSMSSNQSPLTRFSLFSPFVLLQCPFLLVKSQFLSAQFHKKVLSL